jgi:hypothetical protein
MREKERSGFHTGVGGGDLHAETTPPGAKEMQGSPQKKLSEWQFIRPTTPKGIWSPQSDFWSPQSGFPPPHQALGRTLRWERGGGGGGGEVRKMPIC